MIAAVADVRSTVMWGKPPRHGGGVRYPGSGVNGADWFTCGVLED